MDCSIYMALNLLLIILQQSALLYLKDLFLKAPDPKKRKTNLYYNTIFIFIIIVASKNDVNELYVKDIFVISLLIFCFRFSQEKRPNTKSNRIKRRVTFFFCFFIILIIFSIGQFCKFTRQQWGKLDFSQILYNIMNPIREQSYSVLLYKKFRNGFLFHGLKYSLVIFVCSVLCTPLAIRFDTELPFIKSHRERPLFTIEIQHIILMLFICRSYHLIDSFGILAKEHFQTTNLFENTYISPANVHIQFPEKKRNLIYLYVESLENTYATKENGGAYNESLIPGLESLVNEPNNVHFSHSTKLGGYGNLPLMRWSAAGVFSTQSGVPLKPYFYPNHNCYPNAITLTDVLSINGYSTHLASSTPFWTWGTSLIFNTHNTEIHDPDSIFAEKPEYWDIKRDPGSIYDYSMYDYVKEKISKLHEQGKNFFMAIDTIEPHFPEGITCPLCEHAYPNLRKFNKVRRCADNLAYKFIRWVQSQPFGNDTTIFVVGDHLCMGNDMIENGEISPNYKRTVFNLIINSAIIPDKKIWQNRKFSSLDWFPTILAAIGVKIPGERLGMGTNLFSGEPTLREKNPGFVKELNKNSAYFGKYIAGDLREPLLRIVPQWLPPIDLTTLYDNNNEDMNNSPK